MAKNRYIFHGVISLGNKIWEHDWNLLFCALEAEVARLKGKVFDLYRDYCYLISILLWEIQGTEFLEWLSIPHNFVIKCNELLKAKLNELFQVIRVFCTLLCTGWIFEYRVKRGKSDTYFFVILYWSRRESLEKNWSKKFDSDLYL